MKICSVCNISKSLDEYIWKSVKKGIKHSRCKSCMKEYRKNYYDRGKI